MHAQHGNALVKVLVVLALVGGGIYAALVGFREPAVVMEVTRGKAVDAVPGSVEVFADKDLQALKVESAGRVEWCEPLDEGKPIKKGDVLLRLDTAEVRRAFAEATRAYEADKEKVRVTRSRNSTQVAAEKLLADARRGLEIGAASREDVVKAERNLASVQTELELAELTSKKLEDDYKSAKDAHEILLNKMIVVAPADGMVKSVFVATDTLVGSNSTVATFYSNLRIVAAKISEEDYAKVRLDCAANVQLLSYPAETFDAKVIKILPFADPETRRYTVHLEVKAPLEKLNPNSTGEVTITVNEHENATLVPRRAIFSGNFVCVVKDGRVEKRQIELGFKGLKRAEITKGLAAGEVVIVENPDRFRDRQRVTIEKDS
ncbi:MAG TPA: efflux RND transporter periplasmic adaptor subunit [Opitutaceae bacterium]|nr:efflux RND transporter periplasmic adaptor subunit [Opitutaceae bacterium]